MELRSTKRTIARKVTTPAAKNTIATNKNRRGGRTVRVPTKNAELPNAGVVANAPVREPERPQDVPAAPAVQNAPPQNVAPQEPEIADQVAEQPARDQAVEPATQDRAADESARREEAQGVEKDDPQVDLTKTLIDNNESLLRRVATLESRLSSQSTTPLQVLSISLEFSNRPLHHLVHKRCVL